MNSISSIMYSLNNMEIIFTKKNIDSISCISILQNKSTNVILYHLIYDNNLLINYYTFLLWFYYIIGFFIDLKIILLDCEEKEIIKTLK